jgi:hypothetical protein
MSPNNMPVQAAAPHMREAAKREIDADGRARPRCIINVSSVSGTALAVLHAPCCMLPCLLAASAWLLPAIGRLRAYSRACCCAPPPAGVHGSVGQANYSTAKAGVVGLTKAVAKEWGPFGIRCNALTYGYINTRCAGVHMVIVSVCLLGGGKLAGRATCTLIRNPCSCTMVPLPAVACQPTHAAAVPAPLTGCCRLVQSKDKGAVIEVEGEQVKLGIPQVPACWPPQGPLLAWAGLRCAGR